MNKRLQIFIFILISAIQVKSQEIIIGFQTGIGNYSMSDLSSLNETISQNLDFDTEIVTDFPSYWYFRPTLNIKVQNVGFGLLYSIQSTGSRISGKDYSGEYRFDMRVKSRSPGFQFNYTVLDQGRTEYSLFSNFGLIYSDLELYEYAVIMGNVLTDEIINYEAMNYFVEPGFNISYSIKAITLQFNSGYLFHLGKQAFYKDNDYENVLYNRENHKPVKAGWSGYRIGLSILFTLKGID